MVNKLIAGGFATMSMGLLSAAFFSTPAIAETTAPAVDTESTSPISAPDIAESATDTAASDDSVSVNPVGATTVDSTTADESASTLSTSSAPTISAAPASRAVSSLPATPSAPVDAVPPVVTASVSSTNATGVFTAGKTASGNAVVNISGAHGYGEGYKIVLSVPKQYARDFLAATSTVATSTVNSEDANNYLITYSFAGLQAGRQFTFPFTFTTVDFRSVPDDTVIPVTVTVLDKNGDVVSIYDTAGNSVNSVSTDFTFTNNTATIVDTQKSNSGEYDQSIYYPIDRPEYTTQTYTNEKTNGAKVTVSPILGSSDGSDSHYLDPNSYFTVTVPDTVAIDSGNAVIGSIDTFIKDIENGTYAYGYYRDYVSIIPQLQTIQSELRGYVESLGTTTLVNRENGQSTYRLPAQTVDPRVVARIVNSHMNEILDKLYVKALENTKARDITHQFDFTTVPATYAEAMNRLNSQQYTDPQALDLNIVALMADSVHDLLNKMGVSANGLLGYDEVGTAQILNDIEVLNAKYQPRIDAVAYQYETGAITEAERNTLQKAIYNEKAQEQNPLEIKYYYATAINPLNHISEIVSAGIGSSQYVGTFTATNTVALTSGTQVSATVKLFSDEDVEQGSKDVVLFTAKPTQFVPYSQGIDLYSTYPGGDVTVTFNALTDTYDDTFVLATRQDLIPRVSDDTDTVIVGMPREDTYTYSVTLPEHFVPVSIDDDKVPSVVTRNADGSSTISATMNYDDLLKFMKAADSTGRIHRISVQAEGAPAGDPAVAYTATARLVSSSGTVDVSDNYTYNVKKTPVGQATPQSRVIADSVVVTSALYDPTNNANNYIITKNNIRYAQTYEATDFTGNTVTRNISTTVYLSDSSKFYIDKIKTVATTFADAPQITVKYADGTTRILDASEFSNGVFTVRDGKARNAISYTASWVNHTLNIESSNDIIVMTQAKQLNLDVSSLITYTKWNVRDTVAQGQVVGAAPDNTFKPNYLIADSALTAGLSDTAEFTAVSTNSRLTTQVVTTATLDGGPAINRVVQMANPSTSSSLYFQFFSIDESVRETFSASGNSAFKSLIYQGQGTTVDGYMSAQYKYFSNLNQVAVNKIKLVRPTYGSMLQAAADGDNVTVYNVYVIPRYLRYTVTSGTLVSANKDSVGNTILVLRSDAATSTASSVRYDLDRYLPNGTYTVHKYAVMNKQVTTPTPVPVNFTIMADQAAYAAGVDTLTIQRVGESAADFSVSQDGTSFEKDVTVNPDDGFYYVAVIENNTELPLSKFSAYATMPKVGDTFVASNDSRGSSINAVLTGALEDVPQNAELLAHLDVLYTVDEPNKSIALNNFKTQGEITDWSQVTGVFFKVKDGQALAPFTIENLYFPMKFSTLSPENPQAVMSMAVAYDNVIFADGAYAIARPRAYELALLAWLDSNRDGVHAANEVAVAGTWTIYKDDGTIAKDLFGNDVIVHTDADAGVTTLSIYMAGNYHAQFKPDDASFIYNAAVSVAADSNENTADNDVQGVTRDVAVNATTHAGLGVALLQQSSDVVKETIPFKTVYIDDPTLEQGVSIVLVDGVNGEITTTYTTINGVREVNPTTATIPAVNRVVRRGTHIDRYLDESGRQIHEPGNHLGQLEISGYWFVKDDSTSRNNGTDYIYRLIVQKSGDPLSYDLPVAHIESNNPDTTPSGDDSSHTGLKTPDSSDTSGTSSVRVGQNQENQTSGARHAARSTSRLAQTGSDVANMAAGVLGLMVAGFGAMAARRKKDNE